MNMISRKISYSSENYPSKKFYPPKNKKIVFVSGVFNVLHPGHLRLLEFAANQGDYLIVGVLGEKLVSKNSNSIIERISTISALKTVNLTLILDDTPEYYITKLKPHIVVKGKEHETKYNPEESYLNKINSKLIFSSGETKFTSYDLINKEIIKTNFESIVKPKNFLNKHNFDFKKLNKLVSNFKNLNVLVFGDTIIDEYVNCDSIGVSQEDPSIVVRPNFSEYFLGGAGIVASHAKSLGVKTQFYTILGNDEHAKFCLKEMKKINLVSKSYIDPKRPTTHKKRFRAQGKTLLRVNNFSQQFISKDIQEKILRDLKIKIKKCDLIIFSDFNYGMLSQELVNKIIHIAEKHNVFIVADSQSSSQIGDISRFQGAKFITPTEREARLAIKDFSGGLVDVAKKLRKKINADHVLITLGQEGTLIHTQKKQKKDWGDDLIPAMNTSAIDPAGGGDALLTVASLSLISGATIWEAAYLGSIAAACQVGRLGNLPLTKNEILFEINRSL